MSFHHEGIILSNKSNKNEFNFGSTKKERSLHAYTRWLQKGIRECSPQIASSPINVSDFSGTQRGWYNSNTNTYRWHNPTSYSKTSTSSISDTFIRRVVKKNKCQVGNIFRKRYFLLYRGVVFIRRFIIWLEGWEWLLKRNAPNIFVFIIFLWLWSLFVISNLRQLTW